MIAISQIFYDISQGSWVAVVSTEATAFKGSEYHRIPIPVISARWMMERGCKDSTPEKHSAMIPDIHRIY